MTTTKQTDIQISSNQTLINTFYSTLISNENLQTTSVPIDYSFLADMCKNFQVFAIHMRQTQTISIKSSSLLF